MRSSIKPKDIALMIITLILIIILVIALIYDRNSAILKRTLPFKVESPISLVSMEKYGSIIYRTSYEAKIRVPHDDPYVVINPICEAYGIPGNFLFYNEYMEFLEKGVFDDVKIKPNPESGTTVWQASIGTTTGEQMTFIVCSESNVDAFLYVYFTW